MQRLPAFGRLTAVFTLALAMTSAPALEIIAHRGASYDAPENTAAAMKLAFEQGADAAELDIHLSKDGKIAVLHDFDLKRTGGKEIKVADASFEEIRATAVGAWGKWAGRGFNESVPELSDIFRLIPPGKRLFIEIKCGAEVLPALERAFAATDLKPAQLPMITFHYDVAVAAKKLFPSHQVLWLHGWSKDKKTGEYPDPDAVIAKAKAGGLDGVDLNYGFPIDAEFVRKVRAAGLKIYTWTVNDPVVAHAELKAGVDGITTDRPAWLREQLKLKTGARENAASQNTANK
jgi:glycerophosphoryl diester phosphodiesterase